MHDRGLMPFGSPEANVARSAALPLPWRIPLRRVRHLMARHAQSSVYQLVLLMTVLGGLLLRVALWGEFALREDEAIYAYWALHWRTVDPLWLHVWPDKPPLFLWSLAGVMALLGDSQAGARWLNIAVSTLTIPVVGLVARRLWRSPTAGVAAALLFALNPMAISFAPTVYTDPLLVLWGALMLLAALGGRYGWAGAALAAACMTKQQGLLYAPLLFGIWLVGERDWRALARAVCGAVLVAVPFLVWDSMRWSVAPSPWDLARQTYAPLGFVSPVAWGVRAKAWGTQLWYLWSSTPVWLLLGLALLSAIRFGRIERKVHILSGRLDFQTRQLVVLWAWGIGFVLLHLFTTVQVWDRYLLPLVPVLVWVCAGPFAALIQRALVQAQQMPALSWRRTIQGLVLLALLSLAPPAVDAAQGELPLGSDHGDYVGLHEAVAWLAEQPGPLVLYHQALGWHYRFYLFDDLLSHGDQPPRVELRWFPSVAYLADNAAKTPFPPTYVVLPDWAPQRDLTLHLRMRGLVAKPRLRAGRFVVWQITHPSQPACDWCRSVVPFAVERSLSGPPAMTPQGAQP